MAVQNLGLQMPQPQYLGGNQQYFGGGLGTVADPGMTPAMANSMRLANSANGQTVAAGGTGSTQQPMVQNLGLGAQPANPNAGWNGMASQQMRGDWNNAFDSMKPGQSQQWGGGTLTMGQDGRMAYQGGGQTSYLDRSSIDNPNSLMALQQANPGIAKQWNQQYGITPNQGGVDYFNTTNAQNQASKTYAPQSWDDPASFASARGQGGQQATSAPTASNAQPAASGNPLDKSQWGNGEWVKRQADALTAASNQNLMQNIMPGIGQGAQQAGMYGSSRQGVAQGVAAGNAQTGLNSALANLYGTAYGQDQNAYLQGRGLDNQATATQNSYNLGLGGLGLQQQSLDQNFYTQNRNLDQSGMQLGMNLLNGGVNGQNTAGQNMYNAGNYQQQAPWQMLGNYSGMVNPYTGLNQSNTQNGQNGGGWQGALGGALGGYQLFNNWGK